MVVVLPGVLIVLTYSSFRINDGLGLSLPTLLLGDYVAGFSFHSEVGWLDSV